MNESYFTTKDKHMPQKVHEKVASIIKLQISEHKLCSITSSCCEQPERTRIKRVGEDSKKGKSST